MAYCVQADIEKRISQADIIALTDDTGAKVVNTTNLNEAIGRADNRINGALRGKFTVPLTTVPGIITEIAVDLTVYHLYTRRPSIEFPKVIADRYDDALQQLSEIADGTLQPFEASDPALANWSGDVVCNKSEADQIFTSDLLDTF